MVCCFKVKLKLKGIYNEVRPACKLLYRCKGYTRLQFSKEQCHSFSIHWLIYFIYQSKHFLLELTFPCVILLNLQLVRPFTKNVLSSAFRWPAVLSPDPGNGMHLKQDGDGDVHSYHVEFLGNPHSRCWAMAKCVGSYRSIAEKVLHRVILFC